MGIGKFYESLGVPMRNRRNCWGATHPTFKTIYLSVWKEDLKKVNNLRSVRRLLPPELHNGPTSGSAWFWLYAAGTAH